MVKPSSMASEDLPRSQVALVQGGAMGTPCVAREQRRSMMCQAMCCSTWNHEVGELQAVNVWWPQFCSKQPSQPCHAHWCKTTGYLYAPRRCQYMYATAQTVAASMSYMRLCMARLHESLHRSMGMALCL